MEPSIEIKKVIRVINQGGMLAAPTDTVYGLLADATNLDAVQKVIQIKGRDEKKGIPIFVSSLAMAKKFALIDKTQEKFLRAVWPGKVTAVLKLRQNSGIAPNALPQNGTIALRVPSHSLILEILRKIKKPLTGTSANRSRLSPCMDVKCIKAQLNKPKPDLIIDRGKLPASGPSTIIDLTKTPPKALRKGADYEKLVGELTSLFS